MMAFIYLASTVACLVSKTNQTTPWLKTFGFILLCSSGLATGFIFKQHWLGVGVYFVPSMSMHPTLKPGEFILVDTWGFQDNYPKEKEVVVFQHNTEHQWLVKRIGTWPDGQLVKDGGYFVLGDNQKASRDSRSFGSIHQEQIIGKVKLVLLGINQKHQLLENSYLKPVQ